MSKHGSDFTSIVDVFYYFHLGENRPGSFLSMMFVDCRALAELPPKNEFCVWFEKSTEDQRQSRKFFFALPLIIGEIVFSKNEKDHYHVLLQAVSLA